MKTRSGYEYFIEDGKYTWGDCYDSFDTLEEMEEDIYWSELWAKGEAYRDENGEWRRDYEIGEDKLLSILNELFGGNEILTEEELASRIQLLGERENHLIADKFLTADEILEIEERWGQVKAHMTF